MKRPRPITLAEAGELETKLVFKKFETRMMLAIEQERRAASRNGHDVLKAIARDEQVAAIFGEVVAEGSRAGLGWFALDRAFNAKSGSADEAVREHCKRVREAAGDWLVSIVVRIMPGYRFWPRRQRGALAEFNERVQGRTQ
jgi:hypothetical protein